MADAYNINIETKAQLDEIHKLLEELRAISAEMSVINGQTFSAVSSSAMQLSETTKALAEAAIANKEAFDKLKGSTDKTSDSTSKFRKETRKTKDDVNGFSSALQGFYMELGAMGARFATQLPAALFKSIEAFGRQEMAVQKLSAAVRSNGGNVSEVLPIMRQFASEIQRITTYGDEQVLAMQAMASSMGVSSDQMQGVIRSAIGLASALNMDVMTAVKAASAAQSARLGASALRQRRQREEDFSGRFGVGIGGAIRQKLHRACGKYRRFLFRFRRHLPRHRNLRICSQQGVRNARVALGEFLRVGSEFGGGVHFRRVRFGRELLENNGFKQASKCRRSTLCKNRLPERRCVLPTDERRFDLRRLRLRHRDERHLLRQRRLVCGCRPGRVRLVGAVAERIHNPKRSPNVQGRLQADSRIQAARGFAGGVVCEQTHYVFAYAADLVAVGISTDEPRRHARRHIFGKVNADGRHAYRERKKPNNGLGGRRVDRTGAVARALQEDVDIDSVQITAGKLGKTKWHFPRNTLQLGKYRANSENELLQSEPCNHHAKTMQPPRKPNATEGLPQTSKTHIFQNLFHHSTINFRDTLSKSLKWLPAIKLLSGRYSNAPRPFEPIRESLSKIVSFDKSLPCSFKNLSSNKLPQPSGSESSNTPKFPLNGSRSAT